MSGCVCEMYTDTNKLQVHENWIWIWIQNTEEIRSAQMTVRELDRSRQSGDEAKKKKIRKRSLFENYLYVFLLFRLNHFYLFFSSSPCISCYTFNVVLLCRHRSTIHFHWPWKFMFGNPYVHESAKKKTYSSIQIMCFRCVYTVIYPTIWCPELKKRFFLQFDLEFVSFFFFLCLVSMEIRLSYGVCVIWIEYFVNSNRFKFKRVYWLGQKTDALFFFREIEFQLVLFGYTAIAEYFYLRIS